MQAVRVVAALCAVVAVAAAGELTGSFAGDKSHFAVSDGAGIALTSADLAVYLNGAWRTAASGLRAITSAPISGQRPGLGRFTGVEVMWEATGAPTSSTGTSFGPEVVAFRTALENFGAVEGTTGVVVCRVDFPEGAATRGLNATSLLVQFASILNASATGLGNALSWRGSFVQAHAGVSTGPTGGPVVFYGDGTRSSDDVVVVSPLDVFKSYSTVTSTWDGRPITWAGGPSGTVTALPKGFSHSVAFFGLSGGITNGLYHYGQIMQGIYNTTRIPDVTIETLGYQTDNGAQYCFCRSDCDTKLLNMKKYLDGIGVHIGYLSFQGAWWYGKESAPWCVGNWSRNGKYPMPIPEFRRELGVPLQLYAPYFCNDTIYDQNWTMVRSDTSLPGCNDFLFHDAAPDVSLDFYRYFYDIGIGYGMVSFEPDFMNQNYNCVPDFIENIGASEKWSAGMATAALEKNLSVQWCFATPSDLLVALSYPAVTNFRGSLDYYYGHSWAVGESSLLIWALGGRPSKDTFWTTDNAGSPGTEHGSCGSKGCPPDHSNSSCVLHTMIALMTTGPVGFSDAINETNAALILKTCRSDGVLLQPSKAITTIDAAFSADKSKQPPGQVYMTYSGPKPSAATAHYVASFQMTADWAVPARQFWPPLQPGVFYLRTMEQSCKNGTSASSCTTRLELGDHPDATVFTAPKTTGPDPLSPVLTTVTPACASGWSLLGETSKFAALSEDRFSAVACTSKGIDLTLVGAGAEKVDIALVTHDGSVLTLALVIPASGVLHLSL